MLTDTSVVIESPNDDANTLSRRLEGWYRNYSLDHLSARTDAIHSSAPVFLPKCTVKVRKMKRQWGNCSRNGEIKYSLALMQYPAPCVDYVIAHELSHLLHFDHSRGFYSVLEQLCPDWHDRKIELETFGPNL